MPALGQKQTFRSAITMSALPPKADIGACVLFGLDRKQSVAVCLIAHVNFGSAKTGRPNASPVIIVTNATGIPGSGPAWSASQAAAAGVQQGLSPIPMSSVKRVLMWYYLPKVTDLNQQGGHIMSLKPDFLLVELRS